jgi:hypothetical protein
VTQGITTRIFMEEVIVPFNCLNYVPSLPKKKNIRSGKYYFLSLFILYYYLYYYLLFILYILLYIIIFILRHQDIAIDVQWGLMFSHIFRQCCLHCYDGDGEIIVWRNVVTLEDSTHEKTSAVQWHVLIKVKLNVMFALTSMLKHEFDLKVSGMTVYFHVWWEGVDMENKMKKLWSFQ